MSMVRASGLTGYRGLVEELGGDPAGLLESFRIRPSLLDDPQAFLSYASLIGLLEATSRELDCPDFGLRLSTRQDIKILGPLGVAVRNCDNLGDAMQTASRYMFVHSPAISFTPQLPGATDRVRLVFRILLDRMGRAAQVTELSIGLAARTVTLLAASPREAPVTFDHEDSAIDLDATFLGHPIRDASHELRELAEDYLAAHHDDPGTPLSIRVKLVVQRSLGTGSTSCTDVAAAFAMHPRTLQRQLRAEGTTFETLKDNARTELARSYLADDRLPMSRIAALLDYTEQSALSRSCKRWFGKSPRQLRRESQKHDPGSTTS